MIDLRLFRQYVAVAEELNFRRAAERLHIAQPPLSQAIKRLEEELGVQLLERDRHSVRRTAAGEMFLIEARQALAQASRAIAAARRAGAGEVGQLRVAFVGSATYSFLPSVIRAFRALHPSVDLELTEGSSIEIAAAVEADKVDIGFIRPPVAGRRGLALETVLRERFVAALPDGHPSAARHGSVSLSELQDDEFVVFSSTTVPALHLQILKACREAGFSPKLSQQATQIHTLVSLVAAGLGISIVPESARRISHPGVTFHAFSDKSEGLNIDLAAVTKRSAKSATTEAFLSMARRIGAGADIF
ncbi:LysR family transcriptional regulator [Bradyrhizobium ottawaense]|uniref:LysR family transcriptional regulator n=1 Tax=Bradyrhizobium ottawaense TaxID=931866 RepID=UPI0038342EEE